MSDGTLLNVSSGHGNGVDRASGSSFLASKINAAPFVPNTFQTQISPSSTYSNAGSSNGTPVSPPSIKRNSIGVDNVKAAPFVPGAGRLLPSAVHAPAFVPSGVKGPAPHGSPQKPSKMSANATSFIPKALTPSAHADGAQVHRGMNETSPTSEPGHHAGHAGEFSGYWRGGDASTSSSADSHSLHSAQRATSQPPPGLKSPNPKHARGGRGETGRGSGRRGGGAIGLVPGRGTLGKVHLAARFMPDSMRQQLAHRSYLIQAQWAGEKDDVHVPERVLHYHTLYPLDDPAAAEDHASGSSPSSTSSSSWIRSTLYKAISALDGQAYALRRVSTQQVMPSGELITCAQESVAAWAPLSNHPNLIALKGSFVSDEIDNQRALFFVHDYHPGAISMTQAHLEPSNTPQGLVRNAPSEEQLWSYLVQLTAGIRAVHTAGMAVQAGCLLPSKVLLTGFGRVRIGCLGILDSLAGEGHRHENMEQQQREDIRALGRLLLVLACGGAGMAASLENVAAHYSVAFLRVVTAILGTSNNNSPIQSWQSICAVIGERMLQHIDTLQMYTDAMVLELSKEAENGRLLRLLVKLGFINERPDHDMDSQWSETGDRYILKLFRDYVFHQYADDGSTVLEWGHALECLNKLDAGVPEKIVLLSRDEMSMLVVSFADVKRCVENCYKELKISASRRHRVSNTGSV